MGDHDEASVRAHAMITASVAVGNPIVLQCTASNPFSSRNAASCFTGAASSSCALLLADPFPIVVWALPGVIRVRAGRWCTRASPFGRVWASVTAMPVTWIGCALVLWGWHVPVAYDAAFSDRFVHDVEHVTFFMGAVLFWRPVIHPAPRFRRPLPHALRIVYLVLGAFQTAALGLLLTLAPVVLYRS